MNPFRPGMVALVLLFACQPEVPSEIPEIGRNLPSTYAEGQKIFDARLKARFPPGTPEEQLRADLGRQGFPMPPDRWPDGVAATTWYRNEFISKTLWSVRWRAERGRVTDIWGVYGVQAP